MNVVAQFRDEEDARECERLCRLYIQGIGEKMRVSLAPASRFPWNVAVEMRTFRDGGPSMQRVVAFVHGYACALGRDKTLIESVMCRGDLRDGEPESEVSEDPGKPLVRQGRRRGP